MVQSQQTNRIPTITVRMDFTYRYKQSGYHYIVRNQLGKFKKIHLLLKANTSYNKAMKTIHGTNFIIIEVSHPNVMGINGNVTDLTGVEIISDNN